jgi:hypothetical protein
VAMESEDTINKNISLEKIEEYINELEEYWWTILLNYQKR